MHSHVVLSSNSMTQQVSVIFEYMKWFLVWNIIWESGFYYEQVQMTCTAQHNVVAVNQTSTSPDSQPSLSIIFTSSHKHSCAVLSHIHPFMYSLLLPLSLSCLCLCVFDLFGFSVGLTCCWDAV